MSKLNATRVRELFIDCLYREEETDRSDAVLAECIMLKVGFNPTRLENHKEEIVELLHELDDKFFKGKGGGYSFSYAPFDKHGNHWGEHRNAEELFLLGMGIGKVSIPLPREVWGVLPMGLPYMVVSE